MWPWSISAKSETFADPGTSGRDLSSKISVRDVYFSMRRNSSKVTVQLGDNETSFRFLTSLENGLAPLQFWARFTGFSVFTVHICNCTPLHNKGRLRKAMRDCVVRTIRLRHIVSIEVAFLNQTSAFLQIYVSWGNSAMIREHATARQINIRPYGL